MSSAMMTEPRSVEGLPTDSIAKRGRRSVLQLILESTETCGATVFVHIRKSRSRQGYTIIERKRLLDRHETALECATISKESDRGARIIICLLKSARHEWQVCRRVTDYVSEAAAKSREKEKKEAAAAEAEAYLDRWY
jgi:hypothetical protein